VSGTFTGFEGLLAARVLRRRSDDFGAEISDNAVETDEEAYSEAILRALEPRKKPRRIVVTTTTKDPDTSTQISAYVPSGVTVGDLTDAITAAHHGAVAVFEEFSAEPFLRYWEAVQGNLASILPAVQSLPAGNFLKNTDLSFVIGSQGVTQQDSWLNEARSELSETLEEDRSLDAEKRKILSDLSSSVLEEAATVSVDAPAIDTDHQENVHLFWKRRDEGLLAVIRADRSIHFFGSSKGESFRGDYSLDGRTWRTHLKMYLHPLINDAASA
jgi:hypothetical protein